MRRYTYQEWYYETVLRPMMQWLFADMTKKGLLPKVEEVEIS